ncbi:MAG: Wzt carbohydrate-binding domain-containing protein [Microcoleaceae cyanobacterium]
MTHSYGKDFFENLQPGSRQSAQVIVPLIMELIKPHSIRPLWKLRFKNFLTGVSGEFSEISIVDVGCGDGTWLSVFKDYGFKKCLGIDGDYVTPDLLQISPSEFLSKDLTLPLEINQKFDLVLSLEVAEHLPFECADTFVESLVNLGKIIVFSAAIPGQGGEEHINEQWPNYWVDRFKRKEYLVIDCLRKKIWENDRVEPWYAQNILVFIKDDYLEKYPLLFREYQNTNSSHLAIIHPKIYLSKISHQQQTTPSKPAILTSSGIELRSNQNRFGSLEIEITDLKILPAAKIYERESFAIEISYQAKKQLYAPIFGVKITDENEQIFLDINTKKTNSPLPIIKDSGQIKLYVEYPDLRVGNYFVNVGIYERNWFFTYDYHWQIYQLEICSNTGLTNQEDNYLPLLYWELSGVKLPICE